MPWGDDTRLASAVSIINFCHNHLVFSLPVIIPCGVTSVDVAYRAVDDSVPAAARDAILAGAEWQAGRS